MRMVGRERACQAARMATRTQTIGPWDDGDFVLGFDGRIIGQVTIRGLDNALRVTSGTGLRDAPTVEIRGRDGSAEQWLRTWGSAMPPRKRVLVLRDNVAARWIYLKGAWPTSGYTGPISVDGASIGENPGWLIG